MYTYTGARGAHASSKYRKTHAACRQDKKENEGEFKEKGKKIKKKLHIYIDKEKREIPTYIRKFIYIYMCLSSFSVELLYTLNKMYAHLYHPLSHDLFKII